MSFCKNTIYFAIVFLISAFLISNTDAQTVTAGCLKWNMPGIYEQNFPCFWSLEILSLVLTDPTFSPVFKCRNVPTSGHMSYTITATNATNKIPFTVSLWAEDKIASNIIIDRDLKNNFVHWGNTQLNLRSQVSPQCLNYPNCLTASQSTQQLLGEPLGSHVGIVISTTYNLFIKNENTHSTFDQIDIVPTLAPNCLTLQGMVRFK